MKTLTFILTFTLMSIARAETIEGVYSLEHRNPGEVYNVMAIKNINGQLKFFSMCKIDLGFFGFFAKCLDESRTLNGEGSDFTLSSALPVQTMEMSLRCPMSVTALHFEGDALFPKGNADFSPLFKIKKYTPDRIEAAE